MSKFKRFMRLEWQNFKEEFKEDIHYEWETDYKGHIIKVVMDIHAKQLFVDQTLVKQVQYPSFVSHFYTFKKLKEKVEIDGETYIIDADIGGFTSYVCTIKVDGTTIFKEKEVLDFNPSEYRQAILPFIIDQVKVNGKVVNETLPDESYYFLEDDDIRFAPGAADQLIDDTYGFSSDAKSLLKLLLKQLNIPNHKTRRAIYEKVRDKEFAEYVGIFRELLKQEEGIDREALHNEALWFIHHSSHRYAMQFGIMILGFSNCEEDLTLLHTIGLHEEFTLYVADAFLQGTKNPHENLYLLAKEVNGWGKIACVERLEPITAEIKAWLLTNGCENSIMNHYLAYNCAMKGELDVALAQPTISESLYNGAGQIIEGLIEEGPSYTIDEYPHAREVLNSYIQHAKKHATTLKKLYPVAVIQCFITGEVEGDYVEYNGTLAEKLSLENEIKSILENSKWKPLIVQSLDVEPDLYIPIRVAQAIQFDLSHIFLEKIMHGNYDISLYIYIMQSHNRQVVEKLIQFIQQAIDLQHMTPEQEECIDIAISYISDYEGIGLSFIEKCMQLNNRRFEYMALNAFCEWDTDYWNTPTILSHIKRVAKESKDRENRKIAKSLLK